MHHIPRCRLGCKRKGRSTPAPSQSCSMWCSRMGLRGYGGAPSQVCSSAISCSGGCTYWITVLDLTCIASAPATAVSSPMWGVPQACVGVSHGPASSVWRKESDPVTEAVHCPESSYALAAPTCKVAVANVLRHCMHDLHEHHLCHERGCAQAWCGHHFSRHLSVQHTMKSSAGSWGALGGMTTQGRSWHAA